MKKGLLTIGMTALAAVTLVGCSTEAVIAMLKQLHSSTIRPIGKLTVNGMSTLQNLTRNILILKLKYKPLLIMQVK